MNKMPINSSGKIFRETLMYKAPLTPFIFNISSVKINNKKLPKPISRAYNYLKDTICIWFLLSKMVGVKHWLIILLLSKILLNVQTMQTSDKLSIAKTLQIWMI